jgi:hypothetical protein
MKGRQSDAGETFGEMRSTGKVTPKAVVASRRIQVA